MVRQRRTPTIFHLLGEALRKNQPLQYSRHTDDGAVLGHGSDQARRRSRSSCAEGLLVQRERRHAEPSVLPLHLVRTSTRDTAPPLAHASPLKEAGIDRELACVEARARHTTINSPRTRAAGRGHTGGITLVQLQVRIAAAPRTTSTDLSQVCTLSRTLCARPRGRRHGAHDSKGLRPSFV